MARKNPILHSVVASFILLALLSLTILIAMLSSNFSIKIAQVPVLILQDRLINLHDICGKWNDLLWLADAAVSLPIVIYIFYIIDELHLFRDK